MAGKKIDPEGIRPGDIVILRGGDEVCVLEEHREVEAGRSYYSGFDITLRQPRFDSDGIIKHTPRSDLSPQQAIFWEQKSKELALRKGGAGDESSFTPNKIIIILIGVALFIAITTWL